MNTSDASGTWNVTSVRCNIQTPVRLNAQLILWLSERKNVIVNLFATVPSTHTVPKNCATDSIGEAISSRRGQNPLSPTPESEIATHNCALGISNDGDDPLRGVRGSRGSVHGQ